MAYSGQEIISGVLKSYPPQEMPVIRNCSDLAIGEHIRLVNQYIVGVTERDRFSGGISHYEFRMQEQLKQLTPHVKCLAWKFEGEEMDALRAALAAVAAYFEIDLDIEQVFTRSRVKSNAGTAYFLVITVVQYPVVYIQ